MNFAKLNLKSFPETRFWYYYVDARVAAFCFARVAGRFPADAVGENWPVDPLLRPELL